MAPKTITVRGNTGAGKKTLVGNLLIKCGLELYKIEAIERNGVQKIAELVPLFEQQGIEKSFYSPNAQYTITDDTAPDVAIWVVDASNSDGIQSSAQSLESLLSSNTLNPRDKLLIAANKMDLINWSEDSFLQVLRVFANLSFGSYKVEVVPISSLKGGNFISTEPYEWITTLRQNPTESAALLTSQPLIHLL